MSIVLQSSGGGSVTIAEPVTASTLTATLPAATGTVMVSGNMPAFSAYLSANQTPITSATFTKVQCNTEEFDTASAYDNATNYRFTPQVAGYYQVSGSINITSTTNSEVLCVIYKNGSAAKWGSYLSRTATALDASSVVSALIYFNGSTDYVELYGYIGGSGTLQFVGSQARTFFQAAMVRSA
jgi:hypothetical protein